MIRDDEADLVFRDEKAKFNALIDEIVEMQEAGRPVLVGTVSVEKSEILSTMLKRRGIKHETLNAKFHEKESGIVAQAGRTGAVTIATNMAGRGTDILLGGNPAGLASEIAPPAGPQPGRGRRGDLRRGARRGARPMTDEDHDRVVEAGGLHIIGTERHDSRRIDNQLRGRAGRQGDPGSSRFYLSLDDDLMKRFASRPGHRAHGAARPRGGRRHRVAPRVADDRERPEPRRGLQLRHPQARRRVRRRHQQAARDDLRRARQGPPQRGPDRDRPGVPRRGDRRARRRASSPARTPTTWNLEGLAAALARDGPDGEETAADELWDLGGREAIADHLRELADERLARARPRSARRTGARSSGSSCSGRSTRCGSST